MTSGGAPSRVEIRLHLAGTSERPVPPKSGIHRRRYPPAAASCAGTQLWHPHATLLQEERRCGAAITPALRLTRPLGRGGMGDLWVARHLGLGTDVAVKFIRDDGHQDPAAVARFAREAAAAARVRSAHVVQVLDHGVSRGSPFIVMELLRGRDLRALLADRGVLSPDETVTIVRHLSRALQKTHTEGLVHRDVKPSNIFLVDGEGDTFVKLLDFGLARGPAGDESSQTSPGAGTPAYMSPEQIAGQPLDARSDVWSIGVLAFECLTGGRPFEGETMGALALSIHGSTLPSIAARRAGIPTATDVWFSRACARDLGQRFSSAVEASDALAAVLHLPADEGGGDTLNARVDCARSAQDATVARRERADRGAGRRRMAWVGAALVVPLVAAASRGALPSPTVAVSGELAAGPGLRGPDVVYIRIPRIGTNTSSREARSGSTTTTARASAPRAVTPGKLAPALSAGKPEAAGQAPSIADSTSLPDERR